MASLFGNAIRGQYKDFIRAADGGQAVGDGKYGTSMGQLVQRLLYQPFTFIVQCAGCLIQNLYRWVF